MRIIRYDKYEYVQSCVCIYVIYRVYSVKDNQRSNFVHIFSKDRSCHSHHRQHFVILQVVKSNAKFQGEALYICIYTDELFLITINLGISERTLSLILFPFVFSKHF